MSVGEVTVRCRETTGSPVVVLLHGLGERAEAWQGVQEQLVGLGSVAYDRAALSARHPRGAVPATLLARDLRCLLDAGGWSPPYLLVGHSWGGVVARSFAAAHPTDVLGLLLLDATHEHLRSLRSWRFAALAALARRTARWAPPSAGALRELASVHASLASLSAPSHPVHALTGGRAGSFGHRRRVRADFAAVYGRLHGVRHDVVDEAGHDLPREVPARVAANIHQMVAELSGARA